MLTEAINQEPTATPKADLKQAGLTQFQMEGSLLLLLLGLALLLRLSTLNNHSLSYNEALLVSLSDDNSLKELALFYRSWLVQPPFFLTLLHLWLKFFSLSELAVRLFSVVLSVANLGLVYGLIRYWLGPRLALTTLLLLALAPLDLYWAQTARPVTALTLLVTLSMGLAYFASENPRQNWRWLAYGLSAVAVIYTGYLGLHVLVAESVFLIAVLYKNRAALLRLGLTLLLVAACYLPWLGQALEHLNNAPPTHSPGPDPTLMLDALQSLADYFADSALLPLIGASFILLYLFGLNWLWRQQRKLAWWLLCWSLLPVVTGWLGGLLRSNFAPNEFNFGLPAFMAVVAVGFWRLYDRVSKPGLLYAMLGLLLFLNLANCLNYLQNYHTPDFRGAVNYIVANRQEGDLLFLANSSGYSSAVVDYYYRKILTSPGHIEYGIIYADPPTAAQVSDLLKGHRRVWILSIYDGLNWAEKYVYPNLPSTFKAVYKQDYGSNDQGWFNLALYASP